MSDVTRIRRFRYALITIFSTLIALSFPLHADKTPPPEGNTQSLAGTWEVRLDPKNMGLSQNWIAPDMHFNQSLQLPGTTDEAGLGVPLQMDPVVSKEGLSRLQRKNSFIGPVWYRRSVEIPEGWDAKRVVLFLERVLWESRVWVDGKEIGKQDSLSTPHVFDLTGAVPP